MEAGTGKRSLEELLSMVEQDATLRGDSAVSETQSNTTAEIKENQIDTASPPAGEAGAGILSAMLSRPELMAKLPTLLRAIQSMTEPMPAGEETKPSTPLPLLCALRPYLNDHRKQAVDTMIRISKLSETLRTLQG